MVMALFLKNILKIQQNSTELSIEHWFSICVHFDLDLGDITVVEGHDTPFRRGQQLRNLIKI